METIDKKPKREKKKRDPVTVACILGLLFMVYLFTPLPSYLISLFRANPIIRVIKESTGCRPYIHKIHIDDENKEFYMEFGVKTENGSAYESDEGYAKAIAGINSFIASRPDYFVIAENYAIELGEKMGGGFLLFTNVKKRDAESGRAVELSDRIDKVTVTYWQFKSSKGVYLRDMRALSYIMWSNDQGEFLATIDDLSVLDKLERIGPASSFSEEELAWFAENLPNCEVWE